MSWLKIMCVASASLALLTGCGGGEEGGSSDGGTTTTTTSGNGGESGGSTSTDGNGAGGQEEASVTTPEGSLTLFIRAMQDEDFETALLFLDPDSEAWEQLDTMITGMENALENNPNTPIDSVMMRFSLPFVGATHEKVSDGEDAMTQTRSVIFRDKDAVEVTMVEVDGQWYVAGAKDLILPQAQTP